MKTTLYILIRDGCYTDNGSISIVTGNESEWRMGLKSTSQVIDIATGKNEKELFEISHNLFGTTLNPIEGKWQYIGDDCFVYLLQKGDDYEDEDD